MTRVVCLAFWRKHVCGKAREAKEGKGKTDALKVRGDVACEEQQ